MKKSILILFMALFALGLSQVNAQIVLPPTPLDPGCIDLEDPLNVVAGNPYTYEVTIPSPPGNKSFRWYVTQDEDFATAGVYNWASAEPLPGTFLASGDAWYNALTLDADAISLTWQSFTITPGEYLFVVVYVENQQTTVPNCKTNNIKVYRIQPLHAFTLDIANVDSVANAVGSTIPFPTCVDDVQEAHWVDEVTFPPVGGVVYDFGRNIFYYVITGAYYSIGYQLSVTFTGLQGPSGSGTTGQTAVLYWDYTFAGLSGNPNQTTLSEGTATVVDNVLGSADLNGVQIYIKVDIHHNSFEAAASNDFYNYNLAIDGVLVGPNPYPPLTYPDYADIHYANCLPDAYVNDIAIQRLITRPTVTPVDPVFLPIAP